MFNFFGGVGLALITCPECKSKISDTATSCPKCGFRLTPEIIAGIKKKDQSMGTGCAVVFIVVISFFVFIPLCSNDGDSEKSGVSSDVPTQVNSSKPTPSPVPKVVNGGKKENVPVGLLKITGDDWTGCPSRDVYSKLSRYAAQQDLQAFKTTFLQGGCVSFKDGESVFIADTAVFSGLIKVRRKGKTTEYWTAIEAAK